MDPTDELERELEDVEFPNESEKIKHERKQSRSKTLKKPGPENSHHVKDEIEAGDGGNHRAMKGSSFHGDEFVTPEGEVEPFNDTSRGYCKRKAAGSPLDKPIEVKKRDDYWLGCQKQNHLDYLEDRNGLGRPVYSERDHTKQVQNHV